MFFIFKNLFIFLPIRLRPKKPEYLPPEQAVRFFCLFAFCSTEFHGENLGYIYKKGCSFFTSFQAAPRRKYVCLRAIFRLNIHGIFPKRRKLYTKTYLAGGMFLAQPGHSGYCHEISMQIFWFFLLPLYSKSKNSGVCFS